MRRWINSRVHSLRALELLELDFFLLNLFGIVLLAVVSVVVFTVVVTQLLEDVVHGKLVVSLLRRLTFSFTEILSALFLFLLICLRTPLLVGTASLTAPVVLR